MNNTKQIQKERPKTANRAQYSKLPNPKKGSGSVKEKDKLQANQEKQPEHSKARNADKIVRAQSGNDVNGNGLETNLRNGPAH